MAADPARAPRGEQGAVRMNDPIGSWANFVDDQEYVPELRWPLSVRDTYPRMLTDTQLAALTRGTFLPITRYAWGLDQNGSRPELFDAARREFNLLSIDDAVTAVKEGVSPVPIGRTRNRFSYLKHLWEALKAPALGHRYFEQVGEIGDDGLRWGAPQPEFWHLRKLGDLPPRTITAIKVATDGGLIQVEQSLGLENTPLPVSRLVAYVFEPEDRGDWIGRSLLRPCYREWLLKDRLLRVDARNQEKAGGMWWAEAPKDATPAEKAELAALARDIGVMGPTGAVPFGAQLHLERPAGGSADAIGSINRHDEAMARAFLMMFMQLGSTNHGARALGDSFIDWFAESQEAIAGWARDIFNEHVIEDWADWNYGPGEEFVPRLVFVNVNADPAAGLEAESAQGNLTLPPEVAPAVSKARRRSKPARSATVVSPIPLPDRKLRRQPNEHEVRAQVDFKQLDQQFQNEVDRLVAAWAPIRAAQIDDLHAAIEAAGGDLEKLAAVAALPAGGEIIAERLAAAAAHGSALAVQEALNQGAPGTHPDLADLNSELATRASALEQVLARSISEAGARKALQLTGGALTAGDVAVETRNYLAGLTDAYLRDQFGGAVVTAQNSGRRAAMQANGATRLYASELLDTNTCEPCTAIDGTEYSSVDDSASDYPTGGFRDCEGGPRCRGTIVAVYDEAGATA